MRMKFLNTWRCGLFVLFLLGIAPAEYSQTIATGEIAGSVLDSSNAVVIGATVRLKSTDTGESRVVQSNAEGVYRFSFIRPGYMKFLPRNSFRGPGYFNVDASLYKTVPLGEEAQLTFGASAYNVLNHPNFSDPIGNVASSGLGLIKSVSGTPSGPYGLGNTGVSARMVVVTGKLRF